MRSTVQAFENDLDLRKLKDDADVTDLERDIFEWLLKQQAGIPF